MRRIQKVAMFVFVTLTVAFVVTAVAILIAYLKVGFPKAWSSIGFLGIGGIAGVANLIFRKNKLEIECDERDLLIQKKSALFGYMSAFLVFGLATMLPAVILGPRSVISTKWLPPMFMGGGLANFYFWSIAILTQYGWRAGNEEE